MDDLYNDLDDLFWPSFYSDCSRVTSPLNDTFLCIRVYSKLCFYFNSLTSDDMDISA